jgi:predicted CoA-binding protein
MKNPAIDEFLGCQRLALVGASRSGKKFGNSVAAELRQRGYQVALVHPEAKEIDGQPVVPNLAALQGQVDGLIVCVPPARSSQVLRDAAAAGIHNVWLQQGAESAETLPLAQELGLSVVVKKCILMYAPPVTSLHKFHRTIAKIFGGL